MNSFKKCFIVEVFLLVYTCIVCFSRIKKIPMSNAYGQQTILTRLFNSGTDLDLERIDRFEFV